MTVETLIPLKQLNVAEKVAELEALQAEADRYANMGQPVLPGIPDLQQMIKDLIDSYILALLEEIKIYIKEYLIVVMTTLATAAIPYVNKVIRVINKIIDTINRVINTLIPVATVIFIIIIAVTIVFLIAKVLSHALPSAGAGMGAVVVFDQFKSSLALTMQMCYSILEQLLPIGFAIISALLMLLSIFGFLNFLAGILGFLAMFQQNQKSSQADSVNKTAQDWNDTLSDADGSGGVNDGSGLGGADDGSGIMVECTLPDGTVKQMSAADCLAAGGTFPGLNSLLDYNECLYLLQECVNKNSNQDDCISIEKQCDDLYGNLGDLSDLQLNDTIITSLLNLDNDVTVEETTKKKGKRYGFYQSED